MYSRWPDRRWFTGRRSAIAASLALLLLAVIFLAKAAYLDVKAVVAQILLQRAWADSLAVGAPARPWPWADTQAVGRLRMPGGQVDQIVLAGANGRNLAFGPTRLNAGPAVRLTILSGHRDTHFAFLRDLQPGNIVEFQDLDGAWRRYRVSDARIMKAASAMIPVPAASEPTGLVLVTCWPFDAVNPGTPWRFVVSALPEKQDSQGPIGQREG